MNNGRDTKCRTLSAVCPPGLETAVPGNRTMQGMNGHREVSRQGIVAPTFNVAAAQEERGISRVNANPAPAATPSYHDHLDRGNPMLKVYDIVDWRSWERRTDFDTQQGVIR